MSTTRGNGASGFFLRAALVATLALAAVAGVGLRPTRAGADDPKPCAVTAGSLRATLWMQTAAEYHASAWQAYRVANSRIGEAAYDTTWCADLEQRAAGGYESKPPAVILDLDETVLDNSPCYARFLKTALADPTKSDSFDSTVWGDWVKEESAQAIPGALQFLRHAVQHNVTLFFITNRSGGEKSYTIANLRNLGVDATEENVKTKDSTATNPSDKTQRRAEVAAKYRIAMLVGDNLGDLASGTNGVSVEDRMKIVTSHLDYVGSRWIVLPNAIYGGWLDTLGKQPESYLRTK